MKQMLRWFLVLAILLIPMSTAYAGEIQVEAVEGSDVDLSKYEIIQPSKTTVSTADKNLLVSGRSVSGTEVIIELYGTSDLTKKTYNLANLPADEDYILLLTEAIETGNMGYFQKQLVLVNGVNKIIVDFEHEEIIPTKILVYVYDKMAPNQQIVKEVQISNIKPLLK